MPIIHLSFTLGEESDTLETCINVWKQIHQDISFSMKDMPALSLLGKKRQVKRFDMQS